MPEIRQFPLFILFLPFLGGLFFEFHFDFELWQSAVLFLTVLLIVTGLFIQRSLSGHQRMILLGCIGFFTGLFVFKVNDYRSYTGNLNSFTERSAFFSGVVSEHKQGLAGKQQIILEVENSMDGDTVAQADGRIAVDASDCKPFTVGDRLMIYGEMTAFVNKNNPGEFDVESFYRNRKISGHIFADSFAIQKTGTETSINSVLTGWRNYLSSLMEAELDGKFLGIAKALILGDKSNLDAETTHVFSTTGAMHVLAVSGMHIGLIIIFFQKLLSLFRNRISRRRGIIISIILIWIYGGLTGASPSVMRAVVMFTILAAGQLKGRQMNSLNMLVLSALLLLIYDPWMIFDIGFQLSYAAMTGIFLLYRPIADCWVPQQKWLRLGWEGTAVGFAATIVTTPLTLFWFYRFPNYFAVANIGVMIFGFAVLLMGIILLFSSWIPFVIKVVALLFSFSVLALIYWVTLIDGLPGAVSGGFHLEIWELAAGFAIILLWIFHLHRKVLHRLLLTSLTLVLICFWSFKRNEVLTKNELVVFNGNRFCVAVKTGDGILAFYDRKYNGNWDLPRELEDYANFNGCRLYSVRLSNQQIDMRKGRTTLKIERIKNGFNLSFKDEKWFYRYGGTPEATDDRRLMTTRKQLYLDPNAETNPFIYLF